MKKLLWRRFELTGDKKRQKAFLALVKQKGLSREDLTLILGSVNIRSAYGKRQNISIRKPYSSKNITITLPECSEDEIPVLIRKPYSDEITASVASIVSKQN